MQIRYLLASTIRRWYVALPVALVGVLLAGLSSTSAAYTVEGELLLLSPPAIDNDIERNPALASTTAVNTAAVVAALTVMSDDTRDELAAAGFSDAYSFIVLDDEPYTVFELTGMAETQAIDSGHAVARIFVEEMVRKQLEFGADSDALGFAELVRMSPPTRDGSAELMNRALIVLLALALAVVASIALDGYVRSGGWRGVAAGSSLRQT